MSTSVLESEDGLEFGKETQKDTLEVKEQKKLALNRGKSLYDLLLEKKAEKDEEYDQNGRLLRAPSAGLDEEDIEFFGEMKAKSIAAQSEMENKDQREIGKFREKKLAIEKGQQSSEIYHESGKTKSLISDGIKKSKSDKSLLKGVSLTHVSTKKRKRGEESKTCVPEVSTDKSNEAVKALLAGYDTDSD